MTFQACVRRALATVAAAGALITLAATGCGDDDEEPTPPADRPTETTPAEEPSPAAGREIFLDQGCAGCHTLAAADATGTVGPNLDQTLTGESRQAIRRSIVEPNADITEGFSAGVMPQDFGEKLSQQQLDQLVDFLLESAAQ